MLLYICNTFIFSLYNADINLSVCPTPHTFLCSVPLPIWSTGERGLEVCCYGDRSPLSLDLCVCLRVRHDGHVPAAPFPELHSENHQHARLIVSANRQRPWPIRTAGQRCGGVWMCVGVRVRVWGCTLGQLGILVLSCLWNWNQKCYWRAIPSINFIITFLQQTTIFLVWG